MADAAARADRLQLRQIGLADAADAAARTDRFGRCPMTTTGSSEVTWKDGRLWVDCKNLVDGAGELKDYHSELRSQVEGWAALG